MKGTSKARTEAGLRKAEGNFQKMNQADLPEPARGLSRYVMVTPGTVKAIGWEEGNRVLCKQCHVRPGGLRLSRLATVNFWAS